MCYLDIDHNHMTCITHKADDVLIDIQLVHTVNDNNKKGKVHGTHLTVFIVRKA